VLKKKCGLIWFSGMPVLNVIPAEKLQKSLKRAEFQTGIPEKPD